jgi:chromosome segregation ATPase
MKYFRVLINLLPVLMLVGTGPVNAEARREGGEDVLRKAQYMIRQLSQEKTELQKQVAELQAKVDELKKQQDATDAHLEKSQHSNQQLVERVRSDSEKFKTLLERYRDTVKTLRQSNTDNQYLVRAVQEREQWITVCRDRNQGLFAANSDLLARYKKAATRFSEPITGISTVSVENEAQDYRFKLEDLQVTQFKPAEDVTPHIHRPLEAAHSDSKDPEFN